MKKIISLLVVAVLLCGVMMSIPASAETLLFCGFEDAAVAAQMFVFGAFYPQPLGANGSHGGVMYGYSEARVLQSIYNVDPSGFLSHAEGTMWLTYDTVARVAVGVDDMNTNPDAADNRSISMTYRNDNRWYAGRVDSQEYMNFIMDFSHNKVYVTNGGVGETSTDKAISEIKEYELDGNATTWYEVGMSVTKNRLRFFINDELIFDINDTSYRIAMDVESLFLMWNTNNLLIIDEVTVTDAEDMFPIKKAEPTTEPETTEPEPPAPDDGPVLGDVNNDGVHNSNDAVLILRLAAKWSNVTDYPEAADVNQDGVVNAQDAVYMLRALAGWEKYPLPEIPG